MYVQKELEAELVRANVTRDQLAAELGIDKSTLSKKINGKSDWKISEVNIIAQHIGGDKIRDIFFAQ